MNTHFFWLLLLLGALAASPAYALSESEYTRMLRTSEDLRQAEQALREVLTELKAQLHPDDFKKIQDDQRQWKEKELEANVHDYIQSGLSSTQAWAMEMGSRADCLTEFGERLRFKREAKGVEGIYEYARDGSTGALEIRKEDGTYLVRVDVVKGLGSVAETCRYVGTGRIKGNTLNVSLEDVTAATLRITLKDGKADVKASAAADQECDKGLTLSGVYAK